MTKIMRPSRPSSTLTRRRQRPRLSMFLVKLLILLLHSVSTSSLQDPLQVEGVSNRRTKVCTVEADGTEVCADLKIENVDDVATERNDAATVQEGENSLSSNDSVKARTINVEPIDVPHVCNEELEQRKAKETIVITDLDGVERFKGNEKVKAVRMGDADPSSSEQEGEQEDDTTGPTKTWSLSLSSATTRQKSLEEIRAEDGGLLATGYECLDEWDSCEERVKELGGTCPHHDEQLRRKCKVSCAVCERTPPSDRRMTIGVKQINEGNEEERQATSEVLTEMIRYLREEVLVEDGYSEMYKECQNKDELCAFWAAFDECTANPAYMTQNCMLACKKCNQHPEYVHTMTFGF